eukprot:3846698-Amphidinium_carterae.1
MVSFNLTQYLLTPFQNRVQSAGNPSPHHVTWASVHCGRNPSFHSDLCAERHAIAAFMGRCMVYRTVQSGEMATLWPGCMRHGVAFAAVSVFMTCSRCCMGGVGHYG